ncbi:MAG: hypothetical protein QXG00_06250 [Candidatus Woesearchaeota archaeon]
MIYNLNKLKCDEILMFISKDYDFSGRVVLSKYTIVNIDNKLQLTFKKKRTAKLLMEKTYTINTISSIVNKNSPIIPNTIIEGATLFGSYKEGFNFRFPHIIKIKKIKYRKK